MEAKQNSAHLSVISPRLWAVTLFIAVEVFSAGGNRHSFNLRRPNPALASVRFLPSCRNRHCFNRRSTRVKPVRVAVERHGSQRPAEIWLSKHPPAFPPRSTEATDRGVTAGPHEHGTPRLPSLSLCSGFNLLFATAMTANPAPLRTRLHRQSSIALSGIHDSS